MKQLMPLAEAAHALGQSWEVTWRHVLRGTLWREKRV